MDWRWTYFSVDLELTTACREGCRFCPRGRLSRPQGLIARDDVTTILDRLKPLRPRIALSGMGNPLCHPEWPDILKIGRNLGLRLGMVVPASSLQTDWIKDLAKTHPDFLEVSLPSLDPDVFDALVPGRSFAASMANLDRLLEEFAGIPCPITPVGLETKLNLGEGGKFLEYWHRRGFHARFHQCHRRGGHLTDGSLATAPPATAGPCGLFARHLFVCWNGDVLACCHDLGGSTRLGNIVSETLEAIGRKKCLKPGQDPGFALCLGCDEARRHWPVPATPFPETDRARRRHMQKLAKTLMRSDQS